MPSDSKKCDACDGRGKQKPAKNRAKPAAPIRCAVCNGTGVVPTRPPAPPPPVAPVIKGRSPFFQPKNAKPTPPAPPEQEIRFQQQPVRVPPQPAPSLPPYAEPKPGLTTLIIVAQNEAEKALRTVHAALASYGPNVELLLIDDGSEDHLPAFAKKITDPRFLYLRRPWSSGLEAAKRLGEMQASGRPVFVSPGSAPPSLEA